MTRVGVASDIAAQAGGRAVPGRAAAGLVVWGALAGTVAGGLVDLTLIDLLLVFALLVVVPLGLAEVCRLGVHIPPSVLPVLETTAVAGALSLLLEPGIPAAALAEAWLAACILLALSGLGSLAAQRSLHPRVLLPVVALGYLGVGAGWLVASRLGARPLGFSGTIVELTAVHFHFAGFAAPLVAVATAAVIQTRFPRLAALARTGGMGVVAAMPAVAAGFVSSSHQLTAAGAVLLAASLGMLAVVMLVAAVSQRGIAGALLALAAASVLGAMTLAVAYALGASLGSLVLTVPRMAELHGTANALGFCGSGLLGCALAGNRGRGG